MPAFVRSVREVSQGYGSSSNNGSIITNAVGAGATTMVIPATGATTPAGGTAFNVNGGPPPTRGRGRIRATSVVGTSQFSVTVTDGVTTLIVFASPTFTAATSVDITYEFSTDLGITSTTLTETIGTSATIDWEISLT
jgi:hypothetical protein